MIPSFLLFDNKCYVLLLVTDNINGYLYLNLSVLFEQKTQISLLIVDENSIFSDAYNTFLYRPMY